MGLRGGFLVLLLRLLLLLGVLFCPVFCKIHHHVFNVEAVPYTRLCGTKNIITVNGQFPGPTLYARRGDKMVVKVHNHADENVTIHWHGVKQPRNPWSDGPVYITQCPIQPGRSFRYTVKLSVEEGTVWWHAHSGYTRATVHGAIVVHPKRGTRYPFPEPIKEFIIVLGEWWKEDVDEVLEEALKTGGNFKISDAYTINGQPGDLYPCSKKGTFRLHVEHGKRYLLRLVNAAMDNELFFSIARHQITLVGSDGSYTKPLTTDYLMIAPGETMDILLEANQPPHNLYYMAARSFSYLSPNIINNTTTTAILEYNHPTTLQSHIPLLPSLPFYNDTDAAINFSGSIRSLASREHPINVPSVIDDRLIITVAVTELDCPKGSCQGPNGTRLASSLNNISFVDPSTIDILEAYYYRVRGVFGKHFPCRPPYYFNFTADEQPAGLVKTRRGREVKVVEYGARVEVVFQGTSLLAAENHPMHLHGYSFYVVGWGFGNFDAKRDPLRYNLVDPPHKNTFGIPRNGWATIRFASNNPGVWYLHCHLERHLVWGMKTVLIVKDGAKQNTKMMCPPRDMPKC